VYIGIWFLVCYVQQCLFYGRNREKVKYGTVRVLYFMAIYIFVCGFECVIFSKVVFTEVTFRECILARLLLINMAVCKWLFGVVLHAAILCLWNEETESAAWHG